MFLNLNSHHIQQEIFKNQIDASAPLKKQLWQQTIIEKITKLSKFHQEIISSDVILKLENTPTPENKIVEIKLVISGNDLFATKKAKTFEEATDLAVEALRRQIEKTKEK